LAPRVWLCRKYHERASLISIAGDCPNITMSVANDDEDGRGITVVARIRTYGDRGVQILG